MSVSALPKRVQEQLQAAEALEAQDQAARTQAAPAVQSVADLVATPPAPPQNPTPQVDAPAPVPAPLEDIQQKYKTLQGMYAADVVAVRRQAAETARQVEALTAQLQERAKEPPPDTRPAVDPKDIETFGSEMMEMVQRYVTGAVNALTDRIGGLEAKLSGVSEKTAQSAEQQFYTLLGQLVPDWKQINADERWLAWLGVQDEVYGLPRQAALDNAFKRADASQVAKVFQAFKSSLPVAPPVPSLDDQIAPDGAGNPTLPATPAKPLLSEKAITAFYNDLGRGKYTGRKAEADAIEAEINAAVAEGRVMR